MAEQPSALVRAVAASPQVRQLLTPNGAGSGQSTAVPVEPAVEVKETLNDLEHEGKLHASDERSQDEAFSEMYDYFWCFSFSVMVGFYFATPQIFDTDLQKVATNVGTVVLFTDLLAVFTASKHEYLQWQWLHLLSLFGSPVLIFAVNADTHFVGAFYIAYATTVVRLLVALGLALVYILMMGLQRERADAFEKFARTAETATAKPNASPPKQDPWLFRSSYTLQLLAGFACLNALMQLWCIATVIPRAHRWVRKRDKPIGN